VRRIYNEGHTVANHSQTHPFTFHKMSVDQASHEIEGGIRLSEHIDGQMPADNAVSWSHAADKPAGPSPKSARSPAVLDDQQPIGVEARRFTLPSDMPPRIFDEVEERSPDAERGHCATVSSRSDGVLREHRRPHFQDAEKQRLRGTCTVQCVKATTVHGAIRPCKVLRGLDSTGSFATAT
jgi:hypothetical protein